LKDQDRNKVIERRIVHHIFEKARKTMWRRGMRALMKPKPIQLIIKRINIPSILLGWSTQAFIAFDIWHEEDGRHFKVSLLI
jgi:hypothetical protein